MDTNEIMVNEEVIETTEEIATVGSGKGFKVAVGIGLTVFVGVMAYKYVVKPMVAKIKAKKEQQKIDTVVETTSESESKEESEETENE